MEEINFEKKGKYYAASERVEVESNQNILYPCMKLSKNTFNYFKRCFRN